MGLSMAEWEEEAKKLSKEEAREIVKAIGTLKKWEMFHKHYKDTCYHVIGQEVAYAHKLERGW